MSQRPSPQNQDGSKPTGEGFWPKLPIFAGLLLQVDGLKQEAKTLGGTLVRGLPSGHCMGIESWAPDKIFWPDIMGVPAGKSA